MVVVVAADYETVARAQLRQWPGIEIITRPADCGAGLDLLLPLGRVFSRNPDAHVLVTPADHYVPHPEAMVKAVVAANQSLDKAPVILVGVSSGHRRCSQAWILPGQPLGGRVFSVAGLAERASPVEAAELAAAGALWNTSTVVARAEHLWYLAARQLPMQAEAVARLWAGKGSLANAAATACLMPSAELNSALLRGAKNSAVIAVRGSGWTDWTSPEHVMDSIQDPRELELLLSRILLQQQATGRTQLRPPVPQRLRATPAQPEAAIPMLRIGSASR